MMLNLFLTVYFVIRNNTVVNRLGTEQPAYKEIYTSNGFFNIKTDKMIFHLANNGIGMKILFIKGLEDDREAAKGIINIFVNTPSFIQARYYENEYDYWQNVKSLQIYKRYNKEYVHLKLISNGFPPPMDDKVVDISKNNGRRILHDSYVENIGEMIWLSKELTQQLNSDLKELESLENVLLSQSSNGSIMLNIKAPDNVINDILFGNIRKLIYKAV